MSWDGTTSLGLSFDVYSRIMVRDSSLFAPKQQEDRLGTAWEGGRQGGRRAMPEHMGEEG